MKHINFFCNTRKQQPCSKSKSKSKIYIYSEKNNLTGPSYIDLPKCMKIEKIEKLSQVRVSLHLLLLAMGESGSRLLPAACWKAGPKLWFKILRSIMWEHSSIFVCEGILKSYTSFFSQENKFEWAVIWFCFFLQWQRE